MTHRLRPRPRRSVRRPHEFGTREPRDARTRGARRAADAATHAPGDRPRAVGGSPQQRARDARRARARRELHGSTARMAHARALGTPSTATRLHATGRHGRGAARRSRRHRRRASTQPILTDARAALANATETGNVDRHIVSGARHRERRRQHGSSGNASVDHLGRNRRPDVGELPRRLRVLGRRRGAQPFFDVAHRCALDSANHHFFPSLNALDFFALVESSPLGGVAPSSPNRTTPPLAL